MVSKSFALITAPFLSIGLTTLDDVQVICKKFSGHPCIWAAWRVLDCFTFVKYRSGLMAINTDQTSNLLGEQITKRLAQLAMSRREFCRRFSLSRQTLYALEHSSKKGFHEETFAIVDEGMKWPEGTAKGFYNGFADAKDRNLTTEDLVREYVGAIVRHIYTMDIEQLEREVLMLEEEAFGRELGPNDESIAVIRETVERLSQAMMTDSAQRHWGTKDVG